MMIFRRVSTKSNDYCNYLGGFALQRHDVLLVNAELLVQLLDDLLLHGEELLGVVESIDELVEAVGHIGLEYDVTEERGQREREITLGSQ